jgi:hypothetical protein
MTVTRLKLEGYQQGNLWINEFPAIDVGDQLARTIKWSASSTTSVGARKVAIEWLVPTGMGSKYGLLGAQIAPSTGDFQIEVQCAVANDVPYEDTIAKSSSEQVCVGIVSEFGDAVMKAMTDAATGHSELPSARVICNLGAHGKVGSCDVIFYALAKAVLNTLLLPSDPLAADVSRYLTVDELT